MVGVLLFYFSQTGNKFICLILGLCILPAFSHYGPQAKFSVVYQWRFLEYAYNTSQQKEADLKSGNLIPDKPAPIDVDVYYSQTTGEKTVFMVIPRFQPGVPAALGTVVLDKNNNPLIKPYPRWDWFTEPNKCKSNRIVSVFRVMIDECERLWVLDDGQLDADVICPPQILAFDLRTNKLIHKYEIPKDQYEPKSTFVTPVVEILSKENNCRNTFLYLAECSTYTIVVYDVNKQKSWKTQHYTMYPDPDFGFYTIRGESFELMDGVLGLALSPSIPGKGRKLFYHALSSDTEHWVYTKDLQRESLFVNNSAGYSDIFHSYKGRRCTQSAAEAIDKDGIMYFGLVGQYDIACFNTEGEYGLNDPSTDIVSTNKETLQFISGMKVINAPNGRQELWIATLPFQKVSNGNIKNTQVNFRVQVANVESLKKGTRCQKASSTLGESQSHFQKMIGRNKKSY